MQIIKVQFLKGEVPSGKAYTYFSEETVSTGDLVQINSSAKGIVTEVDVSESEIEAFRDKVKTIVGKVVAESKEEPSEHFNVLDSMAAQKHYCEEKSYPHLPLKMVSVGNAISKFMLKAKIEWGTCPRGYRLKRLEAS